MLNQMLSGALATAIPILLVNALAYITKFGAFSLTYKFKTMVVGILLHGILIWAAAILSSTPEPTTYRDTYNMGLLFLNLYVGFYYGIKWVHAANIKDGLTLSEKEHVTNRMNILVTIEPLFVMGMLYFLGFLAVWLHLGGWVLGMIWALAVRKDDQPFLIGMSNVYLEKYHKTGI